MKALLDTHAFLWWGLDDDRLSATVREIIRDGRNEIVVSVASIWEVAIKSAKGKLTLPTDAKTFVDDRLRRHRWSTLAIQSGHVVRAAELPRFHGDPFDRVLIAQAQIEGLPLLSTDPLMSRYDVQTLW